MAGHSQFKNIMHRKGRQDAVRSKMFSKLAREITVAAKMGMPDPAMNPRLRLAIQNAKAQSMPKDNIERAIKKASGGDAENYDEVRYEGYGPGGVAVIVEALTDNRNRSASNIRAAFTKAGGSLGETGSVSFMFDRVGEIIYPADKGDADTVMEAAIEAGAEDVQSDETAMSSPAPSKISAMSPRRWKALWAKPSPSRRSGVPRPARRSMRSAPSRSSSSLQPSKTTMTCRTSTPISRSTTRRWPS